jgi:hypothetical protein
MSLATLRRELAKTTIPPARSSEVERGQNATSRLASGTTFNDLDAEERGQRGFSYSYVMCGRAGEIEGGCNTSPTSLTSRGAIVATRTMPAAAVVLKYCRCMDCRRWDRQAGMCFELGLQQYVSRDTYPSLLRKFWTDVGMIDVNEWHYCASYHGPQISKDIWAWPRHGGNQ